MFVLSVLFPLTALAVEAHHGTQAAASIGTAPMTDGEVRRIDKDAKKLTIKHGPITHLDMPPMTMVFQVKDPGMLEQVKVGDRIRFAAENIGGQLTVTQIEPAK
jgi:Cu/Ag efflux protein CusF